MRWQNLRDGETSARFVEYFPMCKPMAEDAPLTDDLRQLIRCCLAGDQQAMLELVNRFRGQVFGLCYRMLGHRQDAEDAAQETFTRALRNLKSWDPNRDFEPWLDVDGRCAELFGGCSGCGRHGFGEPGAGCGCVVCGGAGGCRQHGEHRRRRLKLSR